MHKLDYLGIEDVCLYIRTNESINEIKKEKRRGM